MKPKRNKGHGSDTLIASFKALISKAISLEIFQSLRSLLIDSSQVSLVLPLPLFTLLTRFRTPLRHRHLRRPLLDMSKPSQLMLGKFLLNWCHPTLYRIISFRTLSLLVCPQNHRNILISATLSCKSFFFHF